MLVSVNSDSSNEVEALGLREWQVAGGLIVNRHNELLLVENRRRNATTDWSTPGGVVDPGEQIVEGLTREVVEETGLIVSRWRGPAYRIEVTAPGFGFHLLVEAHVAIDFDGDLAIDDPDGIVIGAEFADLDRARARLESAPQWVSEPLLDHLEFGHDDGRLYGYRLEGSTADDRRVVRL